MSQSSIFDLAKRVGALALASAVAFTATAANAGVSTQYKGGIATFSADCGAQARFITLRFNGLGSFQLPLVLDPGTHVHIYVPQGATFAADCGHLPADNENFSYVNLD
jgi:hypothetical protein